ncbi:MAG: hypothetical protein GTO41_23710 [Burkholderiales bacterium]|nr:hypothetical protein [Burkholderiales bacterium]
MKKLKSLSILGLALLIIGCGADAKPKELVTVYKSVTCGCCSGWKDHMANSGYRVKEINLDQRELASIKARYGVPQSLMSCHTAVIGDYFVEGHIPSKVIDRLLTEKPPIDGIAMAGMPSGSPGMPGPKNEVWKIYSLKDGKVSKYQEL